MSLLEWLLFSVWTCSATHTQMFQHFECSVCLNTCCVFLCFKAFGCKTAGGFKPKQETNHSRYFSIFKTSIGVFYNKTTGFTTLRVFGGGSPLLTQCVISPLPLPTRRTPLPRIVYSHSEYYFSDVCFIAETLYAGKPTFLLRQPQIQDSRPPIYMVSLSRRLRPAVGCSRTGVYISSFKTCDSHGRELNHPDSRARCSYITKSILWRFGFFSFCRFFSG